MAVSKITVTKVSASSVEYDPSDWMYDEIYDDAEIVHTTEKSLYEWTFWHWYLKSSSGSTIAEGSGAFGLNSTTGYTLSEIFDTNSLAGNYLEDEDGNRARIIVRTTAVGKPSGLALSGTLSRGAVQLSWKAGSAGTNNSVSGYDIEYQDSSDGSTWPSSWTMASGSPTTALKLSVSPPATVGYFRRFRVRTRGSAGLHSAYVTLSITLRRKWDAFGAWTDATLTARQSKIRAVHITEIRQRIDVIRAFYGLSAYTYTPIAAGTTKIAKWAVLIRELRSAVDGIGTAQSWNTLEEGKPRIAHITQLRAVIDAL